MAKILVYSAPSRGHLYPMVPAMEKLLERGHIVYLRTTYPEVRGLQDIGIGARPLSESVECARRTDWEQFSYDGSMRSLLDHLVLRGEFEAVDFKAAIKHHKPDALVVDATCFGALAAAEASGIPWSSWATNLLPFPKPGIPPYGLGLPLKQSAFGAIKNWKKAGSLQKTFDQVLDQLNELRTFLGAIPLSSVLDWPSQLAQLIYFTAEPFEYEREWPQNVHLVGPGNWEPYDTEIQLKQDTRPIVLISCCSEFQDDARMVKAALQGINSNVFQIVVTTAAVEPNSISHEEDVIVERFAAHTPILKKADAVICSGGLGLVQKSLSYGVPVLVVPFCRDQFEVAQRVVEQKVGSVVQISQLTGLAMEQNLKKAIACKMKAVELQQVFNSFDSATLAADLVEGLLQTES